MRKIFTLILVALLPLVVNAKAIEIDGIYYELNAETKTAGVTANMEWVYSENPRLSWYPKIISYYAGEIIIPESVTYEGITYSVTYIYGFSHYILGELTYFSAFSGCSALTSVTIPNSVTLIGEGAFYGCSSLTSITIPNSVTSIGNSTFSGCSGLTTITIPNSVTSIGDEAFSYCSSLTSITIPNSVSSIGYGAFRECKSLTSVTIECPSVGSWFSGISSIKEIILGENVTNIGSSAFSGCSSLTSITIPNSVTSIGRNAFNNTAWYNNQPDGIVYAGKFAYKYKGTMPTGTQVTIQEGTQGIADGAFYDCSGLTSVIISNSVTYIGDYAFYGCSSLSAISIPNNVTNISSNTFTNCYSLKSLSLNCQEIGIWFSGFKQIETVEIGDGTINIVASAFSDCTGLNTLTIGRNVASIGYSAFANCSSLQSVTALIESPFWIDNSVFQYSLSGSTILYVPKGKKQAYQNTYAWNQFPSILEISGDGEQKCATPSISYANGKLKFNCDTEDVRYIYEITDSDIKIGYDTEVDLTVTYNITVYATKDGYQDSDAATATLCWIDVDPQTEGIIDEDAIAEVKAMPVLIQSQGSTITIQGAAEGAPIAIYDIEGKQYGTTIAEKNRTSITTPLHPGSVAIVKIGEKSVKVKL